jgi:hypothetical protein
VLFSALMEAQDFEPYMRYLEELKDDPVRVAILAAHSCIEESIENVITEAVPNSECFDVPGTRIFGQLYALNKLRNAAAHRNYEQSRDEKFAALTAKMPRHYNHQDREAILRSVAAFCFGALSSMQREVREGKRA